MFRIAICDDDRDFIFYLKKRITAVLGESSETEFFEYHSGRELLFDLYGQPEFDVLFLDEPFKGLDAETYGKVTDYVREQIKGRTAILVSHDPRDMERLGGVEFRL